MEPRRGEGDRLLAPARAAVVQPTAQGNGWEGEEKAPFIQHEPVTLTPAWEGANLPDDTLNLKGVGVDLAPPRDRGNLIYLTMVLHGLGTLTAWNMFITEKDYFISYKLRGTEYAANFLSYCGIAAQLPNFLFSWFNVFVPIGGNLSTRIVWSLAAEVALLLATVLLAMLDTSAWPGGFFWCTMLCVLLLNSFNSIFQNSVFGVAGSLPPQYTGAVILGSNVCGTLVTALSYVTELSAGSARTAAIYYFIAGMFVLLVCFDTYFALPLNRFYRYHMSLRERTLRANPALAATAPAARPAPAAVARRCWPQLYNVFVTFFVTLAIFPAMHSDVKPTTPGFLGAAFTLWTCFFTFNVTAMLGNITASLVPFPSPRWLFIFTTLRFLLFPFFMLCNYQPDPTQYTRTLPVLVTSDWAYWAGSALLGWSSGHCSSLAMMYVGRNVSPESAGLAGMVGGATLISGIMAGVLSSRLCPALASLPLWARLWPQ